jgi:hypothetical protein
MRVLIIPEDPTLDRYVVQPIVERIFHDLGRTARVEVLTDPHLSGVEQALDSKVVAGILEDNRMIDLFLLVVDRDCDRRGDTNKAITRQQEHPDKLVAALALEELEVWALAPHRAELPNSWSQVRSECDPKERYSDPFVESKGWLATVGKGRKKAMRDLGNAWAGVLSVCPEIAALKSAIQKWLSTRTAG